MKQPACLHPLVISLGSILSAMWLTSHAQCQQPATLRNELAQSFVQSYCAQCHEGDSAEAELDLVKLAVVSVTVESAEHWATMLDMIATGEMPPPEESQPEKHEIAKFTTWLKAELHATGYMSDLEHKLLYPEYGNLVDHAALFDGTIDEAAWSPSRIWKRSPHIFDDMIIRGMGFGQGRYGRPHSRLAKIKQPFTLEDQAGIRDYAAILFADSATLGTMMRNAESIVDQMLSGAIHEKNVRLHGEIPEDQLPKDKKGKPIRPRHHKTPAVFSDIVLGESEPTDDQIESAIVKMFETIIDRPPTEHDVAKYRNQMRQWIDESDPTEALRTTMIAIAISPQAVYRSELGTGEQDSFGRRMLAPADLAYAISYALTDNKPDELLQTAAMDGRLTTRDDVRREVVRIWDDESIAKPRILRFFHEFFGYHNAPNVFKDVPRFGKDYRRVPEALVADADTLVNYIVEQDRDVLVELLTTEKYFVAHSGDNEKERQTNQHLTTFYNYFKELSWKEFPYQTPKEHAQFARSIDRMFAHPNGNVVKSWMRYLTKCDENGVTPIPKQNQRQFIIAYDLDEATFDYPIEQPFVLAKGKRAGILMHPAWLIAHSLNLDNDPVRRGKWIRERLLADKVPDLPITVDARIPDAPELSLRKRYAVTRQNECWRCHVKMNPVGMPFESFDDFGRFRQVEVLHAKGKTKPVDASGFLTGTGNESLDGPVDNPIEMMNRLAQSERVRQSFVRHAFRYWMGRNEMLSDSATLMAADQAYIENQGSFRALVISLLTSDSFLYRKPVEFTP